MLNKANLYICLGPNFPPNLAVIVKNGIIIISWRPSDEYTSIKIVIEAPNELSITRVIEVKHFALHFVNNFK